MGLIEAKEKAQQDLFEAVSKEITNLPKITSTAARAAALRELAAAYRHTAGGAQPGSAGGD